MGSWFFWRGDSAREGQCPIAWIKQPKEFEKNSNLLYYLIKVIKLNLSNMLHKSEKLEKNFFSIFFVHQKVDSTVLVLKFFIMQKIYETYTCKAYKTEFETSLI